MARVTVSEPVGTVTAVGPRRVSPLWRLLPLAFYLLAFSLVRGDLARLPGGVGDVSLHPYFSAMVLYVGGIFFYCAFFACRTAALPWFGVTLVWPRAAMQLGAI